MEKINFTKMVASGNDFVVIEARHQDTKTVCKPPRRGPRYQALAKRMCDRKFGVGADGLLVLGKSKYADMRMRIFNADGTEAEMCGNGARCSVYYLRYQDTKAPRHQFSLETKAGIIEAKVEKSSIKIRLTEPKDVKLDIPIKINNRLLKVNSINTGVPHAVIFVAGLDKIDVAGLGRQIRYHEKFKPSGTNADFIEVINNDSIKIRTYERGVEDETLACGTGSVASALIFSLKNELFSKKINVHTQSGEILKVNFETLNNSFHDVWLEGKARIVYSGVYHV